MNLEYINKESENIENKYLNYIIFVIKIVYIK